MQQMRVGLAAAAALAAACAGTAGSDVGLEPRQADIGQRPASPGEPVLVRTAGGQAAINAAGERVATWVRHAEAAPDGSVLYRMDGPFLDRVSPEDGRVERVAEVGGGLVVRVVGPGGTKVVVMPRREGADPYRPEGRAHTQVAVVDTRSGVLTRHDLDGNYEPEALATDGGSLFVIEYNPPLEPDRYRVRRLDLETGEVLDVFSPDKHLQEEMRGTARTQVMAADGKRLYTLYTLRSDHHGGEPVAFVHVLDLEGQWAHCVDLPAPLGRSDEMAVGLALDATANRLLAVDRAAGAIAEVDTVELVPVRVVARPELAAAGGVPSVAVLPGRVVVAIGNRLQALDRLTLGPAGDPWTAPEPVESLRPVPGGSLLIAAGGDRFAVIDGATGTLRRTLSVPGSVLKVRAGRLFDPVRGGLECAC